MPASSDARKSPPAEPGKPGADPKPDQSGAAFDDEEDQWRHDPVVPPKSDSPLDSLGRSVSEVVTGSAPDQPAPKKPR